MDGAAQVLVIILAVMLAVFLVLSITLTVLLIKISQQIKSVTESAERTVHSVETAASNMSKFSSPLMLVRMLKGVVDVRNKKKGASHVKRK